VRTNGDGKPIVALDLDGTLGDYHSNFLEFADRYFGTTFPKSKLNPGLKLWQWMGISQRDYQDAKLAYRQGGWKRWMPCYSGVHELTAVIRAAGAEVWLCTTRPYLRLDNVDPDTREWLGRNRIQYDALLFDPAHKEDGTKYDELARQAGTRVAAVVDDLPEMLQAAHDARVPGMSSPILRDQPYNRHLEHFKRAHDSQEMWEFVSEDLKRWREVYG
jgi:phosphoglycolate phosphatase-like HAD superfamily hydrolase